MNLTLSNPANATPEIPPAQFNVKGGLLFAGANGLPRELYNTPKSNITRPHHRFTLTPSERA